MTAPFTRAAQTYLEMLANDIANGARLWSQVQTIENRFRSLRGFTLTKVERIEQARAMHSRRVSWECLRNNPDNWWHRMSTETFLSLQQEFGRI